MKKRFVSILLVFALMLGTFAFSAFAEGTHKHDACGEACEATAVAVAPKVIQAEVCNRCYEQAAVFMCNRDYSVADTGSHGSCTVTYFTSRTFLVCNACGYRENLGWHPICDERHSSCGRGLYATCTVEYY